MKELSRKLLFSDFLFHAKLSTEKDAVYGEFFCLLAFGLTRYIHHKFMGFYPRITATVIKYYVIKILQLPSHHTGLLILFHFACGVKRFKVDNVNSNAGFEFFIGDAIPEKSSAGGEEFVAY